MKKLLFAITVFFLFQSCIVHKGTYTVGLTDVERPTGSYAEFDNNPGGAIEPIGDNGYSYEDEKIRIIWITNYDNFSFAMENKTDQSIKILWDNAAYVNENGMSGRIMHKGVKYNERNQSQTPTIVVAHAKISDIVLPTDNVYFMEGQYGGWRVRPLFDGTALSKKQLALQASLYLHKTVQVLLPMEIDGEVNDYVFSFKVEDFRMK